MKYSREFPSSFKSLVKICKYLFHVLAHIYSSQFRETLALKLHRHLNTLYICFILFTREFNLLGPQEIPIMYNLKEVLCSGETQDTEPCAGHTHTHTNTWLDSCAHVQGEFVTCAFIGLFGCAHVAELNVGFTDNVGIGCLTDFLWQFLVGWMNVSSKEEPLDFIRSTNIYGTVVLS